MADTPSPAGPPATARPGEYLPGHPATVEVPDGTVRGVVVLVPGGGWQVVDPSGLRGLGEVLVAEGFAVVTITYGTSALGDTYPRPVDDVACAVAFAADRVPGAPVAVVGHSAGAHLALLVGLAPERDDPECPYEPVAADAVVGLAGPYDVERAASIAEHLFGVPPADAPDAWTAGNPLTWADRRPELPVLLVHGDADDVVPLDFTTRMADALEAGGHAVAVELLPGVTHASVYRGDVVGQLTVAWLAEVLAR